MSIAGKRNATSHTGSTLQPKQPHVGESEKGGNIDVDTDDAAELTDKEMKAMIKQTYNMMKHMKTGLDHVKVEVGMAAASVEKAHTEIKGIHKTIHILHEKDANIEKEFAETKRRST